MGLGVRVLGLEFRDPVLVIKAPAFGADASLMQAVFASHLPQEECAPSRIRAVVLELFPAQRCFGFRRKLDRVLVPKPRPKSL